MSTYEFTQINKRNTNNTSTEKDYKFPGFINLVLSTPEGDVDLFNCSISVDNLMKNYRKSKNPTVKDKYINTLLAVIEREYENAVDNGEPVALNDVEAKVISLLKLVIKPTTNEEFEPELLDDLM